LSPQPVPARRWYSSPHPGDTLDLLRLVPVLLLAIAFGADQRTFAEIKAERIP
jgi:hypothetical protein